jgi:hypothetical protein
MREVCNYVMPQLHRKTVKIVCGDTGVPSQERVVIVVVLSSCCDSNVMLIKMTSGNNLRVRRITVHPLLEIWCNTRSAKFYFPIPFRNRDSSVGIATGYGLDGRG